MRKIRKTQMFVSSCILKYLYIDKIQSNYLKNSYQITDNLSKCELQNELIQHEIVIPKQSKLRPNTCIFFNHGDTLVTAYKIKHWSREKIVWPFMAKVYMTRHGPLSRYVN